MRLVLEITSGPLKGKRVTAEDNQVVRIGRTAKADFSTEDSFMSGEHFAVEGAGRSWRIRDLKSRNGTKLNGKVISSAALQEGDVIHAGSTDFIVRLEAVGPDPVPPHLLATLPPTEVPKEVLKNKPPTGLSSVSTPGTAEVKTPERKTPQSTRISSERSTTPRRRPKSGQVKPVPPPVAPPAGPAPASSARTPVVATPMDSYEAATPEGRLLRLLQTQREPLMALVDGTHDRKVLKLLNESGEQVQSLYQDPRAAALAPYLVLLPPGSQLLKQMVHEGWGRGWGVYLTCALSLAQVRDYFRKVLMVTLPDGVELFSRFYDPRYFRVFLETCTVAEGVRFFGPISSYLMEAEKPEILLQFTRTASGVEKKGHLIATLE